MKLSVQKIYAKGSHRLNEDELLIKDNLYVVFDGASSLVPYISKKGKTGAKIAAKIAKKEFSKNIGTLKQLAIDANTKIREEMKKEKINMNRKEELWCTSAAILRLKDNEAKYLVIGDCFILAINRDASYGLLVPYYDQDLETMKKWRKLADNKVENIWSELKPYIVKVRKEENIKYGCLSGEKEAVNFFKQGRIHLKDIKSLILFTDGLLIPKEDPEEDEDWDLFVKIYQKSGLKGLLKYVRDIEKKDPKCWKYPRYKQHDDATAIAIDFN